MRDTPDRHYPKRLAASYFTSLVLHTLLAALLFAVVINTSRRGATQGVLGGEVVTIEQRVPVRVPRVPVAASLPKPNAPKIAPLHRSPLAQPAHQPQPPRRHILAQFAPTAPPNPSPIPQASLQPAPQPTRTILEIQPENAIAAAPVSIASAAPIALVPRSVPSPKPSPQPTQAPTQAPTAAPSVAPTARPSPKPPTPTTRPAPSATPLPVPKPPMPLPVATHPGVPSPSPTHVPALRKRVGRAAHPARKRGRAPGPHAGAAKRTTLAARRPIEVQPTAPPAHSVAHHGGIDINARLRALLPHNAVHPTMKEYTPSVSLRGRMNPTPPPQVLAKTKYLLKESKSVNDRKLEMWVTSVTHRGPFTLCHGWLVRYPHVIRGGGPQLGSTTGIQRTGGIQAGSVMSISLGGGVKAPWNGSGVGLAPIVEANATSICNAHELTPFSPAPPSP